MRGFRSTLILLVVLAGLVGYIYFYLKPGQAPEVETKPKVFTVESAKIEELQITGTKGETAALKKAGDAWQLQSPVQASADENEVMGIVTNLSTLENQRTVDENPADLAAYGLAKPRVQVAFRTAGDKDFTRLLLGDKTATGADLYAKIPSEKKVFLVSAFLEATFDRTPFDLRNKEILAFARDKVDRVEVASKDQTVAVAKDGDRWRLTAPLAARADTTVVDGLIGRIQGGRMKTIESAAPSAADLTVFGLDKPFATVTLGAGSTRATLSVGKAAPDGTTYYARDAARPMVFTVEKSLGDDLVKKPADYRMKDVFEFRPFMASRLEVTRGGATTIFEKAKGKDGVEKWTQSSPKKDVDAAKVETLLSSLAGLQVAEYVDASAKTGIDAPVLAVAVTFDDGKRQERVTFGRAAGNVYAARPGEPGAARVEAAKFDEAVAALDALK
jgi:hypothetical protein